MIHFADIKKIDLSFQKDMISVFPLPFYIYFRNYGKEIFRIVLETKLCWYVSTHTYLVSQNIYFSAKTSLTLLMSTSFGKNSTFTQSNRMRDVSGVF